MIRQWLPTLFVLFVALGLGSPPNSNAETLCEGVVGYQEGNCSPPFAFLQDDQEVSSASFLGNVVVVYFWASYCGFCKKELPLLHDLYVDWIDRDFIVLAVSLDKVQDKTLRKVFGDVDPLFPMIADKKRRLKNAFGVRAVPTSVVIDRTGRIRKRKIGAARWNSQAVREELSRWLEETTESDSTNTTDD